MGKVLPGRPRAIREAVPGGVRITVRTRRHWPTLLFLPVWIAGWAFGEAHAIAKLAGSHTAQRSPTPTGFLVLWLAGWTVAGVFVIAAFLWNAFGREVIELAGRSLKIRRHVLGIGRTREYDVAHVQSLRVSAAPLKPFSQSASMRYWGFGNGLVAFDYGARTVRVLSGLDEAEASSLVNELRARLGAG